MVNATNNFRDWLLVANGAQISNKKLHELAQDKHIMVLDGAYAYAKQAGLNIEILLGDFDSITAEDLTQAKKTAIKVIHAPDQNKTDLEKGLEYIDATNPKNIYICAATGLRLQHSLYNLRILKKYYKPQRPLILFSDTEVVRYYQDTEIIISGKVNDSIGILGFSHGVITTSGLKYDVTDYALQFEKGNSVLNALDHPQATVKIHGSALVIHERLY